jgi:ribose-phosphate pyrophosphokinase
MSIIVNGKPIKQFNFNGGECHVSIAGIPLYNRNQNEVVAFLKSSDEIMRLLMTVNAIREVDPSAEIALVITYFPYARQDRVCNEGEAFSVKVMAGLINGLDCESVSIVDPHSNVTLNHLALPHEITQTNIIDNTIIGNLIKYQSLTLVAPDAGATNKVKDLAYELDRGAVYCTKDRDPATGQILDTHIPDNVGGKNYIIIDDICDGGRTFIELAKLFKENGAGKMSLYVTHGIFSKGLDVLREHFDHVYCYHTFLELTSEDREFVTVIEEYKDVH